MSEVLRCFCENLTPEGEKNVLFHGMQKSGKCPKLYLYLHELFPTRNVL